MGTQPFRTISAAALLAMPSVVAAQSLLASPLTGLLNRAAYMNVFVTGASVIHDPFAPDRKLFARGVGFELAFGLAGGKSVARRMPSTGTPGSTCLAKFSQGQLAYGSACADTSVRAVTRRTGAGTTTYEETLEIKPFSWRVESIVLDLGLAFTQTGAFVAPVEGFNARASLRELPAVTVYANFVDVPVLRDLPFQPSFYVGARTGFLTLYNGRAYVSASTIKFSSETLQLGGVAGVMLHIRGVGLFAESALLWRDFKSVDWETTEPLPAALPRRIDFSGRTLLVGAQFEFAR